MISQLASSLLLILPWHPWKLHQLPYVFFYSYLCLEMQIYTGITDLSKIKSKNMEHMIFFVKFPCHYVYFSLISKNSQIAEEHRSNHNK